jgi:outer membrane porin, OprD family
MNSKCLVAVLLGLVLIFNCSRVKGQSQTAREGVDALAPQGKPPKTREAEEPGDESAVTPTSTEQGQTLVDDSFETPNREATVREKRRQAFIDTDFSAQLRSFDMDSKNLNGTQNEAWALGGSGGFKTGYFRDLFAFAATAYTSQRLEGPEDKGGTQLLAPPQRAYSVVGEAYAELLLASGLQGTIGFKGYDTPYLSRNDSRMTPNTFEAAAIQGSFGGSDGAPSWRFGVGYFDKIKERDSETFVSMAAAAGAPAGISRGVSVAGATYKSGSFYIGGVEYYSKDIINIAYVEAKDAFALSDWLRLQVAAQHTKQQSVGDDLLMGRAFFVDQFGIKAELAFGGMLLTGAYTSTGSGNGVSMQSPWSGYPGYTAVQIQNFNRSGENASMIRAAYNFPIVKGLSTYALYVHGSQPNVVGQYAQGEYDVNVQWKAPMGKFQGVTLLARYGLVSQAGPVQQHTNQFRLALYYTAF